MREPWLDVPLSDYEAHMSDNRQLGALSLLFARALELAKPASVAVLGVAGGNGLEHIDPAVTQRVCGVDLNPEYLEAVRARFRALPKLELMAANLAEQKLALEPFALVHAALIFEHAGTGLALENALALVAPGGWFSVVLQCPSMTTSAVAATARASIRTLAQGFCFVDQGELCTRLKGERFTLVEHSLTSLPEGKAFWQGIFRHDPEHS